MPQPQEVIADLVTDADELDGILAGLERKQWQQATPAPGWTIAHQVAHLTATFRIAALAARDPDRFTAMTAQLSDDFDANVAAALAPFLELPPDALNAQWQEARQGAVTALRALPPDTMVPWLVRPLPASILAAAGTMELFAHGQDICDALGATRPPTDRLRHLVAFAVRTWDFGYLARQQPVPDTQLRFVLTAPSGACWEFGPQDATQCVTGPVLDFCLLVTRRRHRADLALRATGAEADRWLDIAQAYRGTPGAGRSPGQFAGRVR